MIITLTLGPGVTPELCFASSDLSEHLRFIRLSGTPNYEGTYRYWDIRLLLNGELVERPARLSIIVRESDARPSEGRISYLEAYENEEHGIRETAQFSFEVDYPPAAFERLWSVVSHPTGELKVSVSVKAPRTDASGHEAIFEISELSNTWPTKGFYASRT